MDPAGTLISIATIAVIVDELVESYKDAPRALLSIKTQIKVLEAGVQRIQEWLHFTEPTSKAHVLGSLQDATATVDASIASLKEDLDAITNTGPKTLELLGRQGSDCWAQAKFTLNEGRLRKHLTDMRECVSLMHFTLTVCQLPLGQAADREVKELGVGARTLSRAHKSTRAQRRPVVEKAQYEAVKDSSPDFYAFMDAVMAAENDLPDDVSSGANAESSVVTDHVPLRSTSPSRNQDKRLADASNMTEQSGVDEPLWDARGHEGDGSRHDELFLPTSGAVDTIMPPHAMPASANRNISPDQEQPGLEVVGTPSPPMVPLRGDHSRSLFTLRNAPARPPKEPLGQAPMDSAPESIQDSNWPLPTPPASVTRKSITRKPARQASADHGPPAVRMPSTGRTSIPSEKVLLAASDSVSPDILASIADATERASMISPARQPAWSPDSFIGRAVEAPESVNSDGPPPYRSTPSATTGASPPPSLLGERKDRPNADLVEDDLSLSRRSTALKQSASSTDLTFDPVLMRAVRENRGDVVIALLDQGVDVDGIDAPTGHTALIEAARLSRFEICQYLIEARSRLEHQDIDGKTALHHAAISGDSSICRMLFDSGAQLDAHDKDGRTPLFVAAEAGRSDAVICILQRLPKSKTNDPELLKAFYAAVKTGNVRSAQAFLTKDFKLKKITESPWKPAAYAAISGNMRMLEIVTKENASLRYRSPDGWTVLHFAARHGHHAMVEKLLALKVDWKAQTKKQRETALHLAVAARHELTIDALLAHKDANVNINDADGIPPLHHAVRNGDIRIVTALLDAGAKLKVQNEYGWKAVHLASAYGRRDILMELITRGANANEPLSSPSFKPNKKTNEAARRGYWAEIRWPHAEARPLHLALEFGRPEVVRMLIAAGASVNEPDALQWRPLHYAAFHCAPDIAQLLIEKGASPHATTTDGNTPEALGFREYGLVATNEDKRRVQKLLGDAALAKEKSGLQKVMGFRIGGPSARTAKDRNQCWHTAEMAESLYKGQDGMDEGLPEDDVSVLVKRDPAVKEYEFGISAQAVAS